MIEALFGKNLSSVKICLGYMREVNFNIFIIFTFIYCVHVCAIEEGGARGQLAGVRALFPLCMSKTRLKFCGVVQALYC